jgi:hypothetical protein
MQVPVQIPAVWVQTTSDLNNAFRPEGYPNFLTPEQQARAERIRQARMLFDGKHRDYYLTENRTQSDFARLVVGSRPIQPYVMYNVLELISNTGTDLLLAEEPLIRASDPYQQKSLQELSERCMLHSLFYDCALNSTYEGDTFIEACIVDGEVCLQQIPGEEIFPVGLIQPNRQYRSYVRYNLKNIGSKESPIWLLREITYSAGMIQRACWQLDREGKKQNQVDLGEWIKYDDTPLAPPAIPAYGYNTGPIGYNDPSAQTPEDPQNSDPIPSEQLKPITQTGIDQCTVTWIPNRIIRGQPASDYGNLLDLQDAVNYKNTQLSNIFAKHADPALASPQESADDQGNTRAANKQYFYDAPERIPRYITWDAETKSAQDDRDFALTNLIVAAESSPVLLGVKSEGVKAIAFKSIKLMSLKAITKAKRKALYWKAGIARALSVAQALEISSVPGTRYDTAPLSVELQDGIPNDSLEVAQEISLLTGGKQTMSVNRAVRIQIQDPVAADAEIEKLEEESAAATPTTFFPGAPGAPPLPSDVEGNKQPEADAPAEVTGDKADKTEAAQEVEA